MKATQATAGKEPAPMCECGHATWYHEDKAPRECQMYRCRCKGFRRVSTPEVSDV